MDDVFKENYITYIFSLLPELEVEWKNQIVNMHDLWMDTGRLLDKNEFLKSFSIECEELNLPAESYNINEAFHKANNEWSIELMLTVSDWTIKFYHDDIDLKNIR